MLINRNRKDGNPELADKANIYLDGVKQQYCFEACVLRSHRRKGAGYVIRTINDEKPRTAIGWAGRSYHGIAVEKVFGEVEVRVVQ